MTSTFERLEEIRKVLAMSKSEFTRVLGLSPAAWNKWSKGIKPRPRVLQNAETLLAGGALDVAPDLTIMPRDQIIDLAGDIFKELLRRLL